MASSPRLAEISEYSGNSGPSPVISVLAGASAGDLSKRPYREEFTAIEGELGRRGLMQIKVNIEI